VVAIRRERYKGGKKGEKVEERISEVKIRMNSHMTSLTRMLHVLSAK
jgi:hypothetical protein